MSLMKWPGTTDKPNKPDLSSLSDDQLDDLMVKGGLMEQDELDRQRESRLMIALVNLPELPEYFETLRGLVKLRDAGPFPHEAQDLHDRLHVRAMADVKAARKAVPKVTPPPADVPDDVSLAGWLKFKWRTADASVRHTLRTVAEALGVSVPMSRTRTRPVVAKDSTPARRTESEPQPTHVEQDPPESTAEKEESKERGYHDPPEWDDDDADGWAACTSLHDAFRSDADWY